MKSTFTLKKKNLLKIEEVTESEPENDDSDIDEDNIPDGVTLEKELQNEERDVLEDLQNVEVGSSQEDDLVDSENMLDMEGVQDLESVDLAAHTPEGGMKTEVDLDELSDLDELGEEFEGEKLDLEDISRQNLTPIFSEHFEIETAPGKEI